MARLHWSNWGFLCTASCALTYASLNMRVARQFHSLVARLWLKHSMVHRLPITREEVQLELDRRRPGQSRITTPRKESDTCDIYSGLPANCSLCSADRGLTSTLRLNPIEAWLSHESGVPAFGSPASADKSGGHVLGKPL